MQLQLLLNLADMQFNMVGYVHCVERTCLCKNKTRQHISLFVLKRADYTGNDLSRASINMTHDALGVTISKQEAERIENAHATELIAQKKLLLILDLDQTIIHATVDPTVGEWMRDQVMSISLYFNFCCRKIRISRH